MIECQQRGSSNPVGAAFCADCGGILMGPAAAKRPPGSATSVVEARGPAPSTSSWATLYVAHGSPAFRLAHREEFALGHADQVRRTKPDMDLSPFEAYTNGVSRMHAVIRSRGAQVVLMDLGSANGTYVNGRRLSPRQEAGLGDGDMIALGVLKIQIRLKTTN